MFVVFLFLVGVLLCLKCELSNALCVCVCDLMFRKQLFLEETPRTFPQTGSNWFKVGSMRVSREPYLCHDVEMR